MAISMFAPVYDVDSCIELIRDCLEKGWTGQGYKTVEFEEAWKKYTGFPHAHFLTTATAGLNLAIETMKEEYGWHDGDEIISTPLTFIATNNCILFSKLRPVFADIDDTLCLDPIDVEKKITDRTKAVIFVGIGGNTGQYEKIVQVCKKYGLKLILDAAHMAGTRLNGIIPGREADAVVYSFHVTKNLSLAEGGMLCFRDEKMDEIVRKKSFNGIDKTHAPMAEEKHNKWEYDVKYLADSYNGNSIIASIGLAQLPHLDKENVRRREISNMYECAFKKYSDKIVLIRIPKECVSSSWLYQIVVDDRDGLLQYMTNNQIGCGIHYPDNTLYWMYASERGKCPNAEYYSEHLITLPVHMRMTDEDVHTVIEKVISYLYR